MKEIPDYETYPISEEEMGKRYKNWTKALAQMAVLLYKVGKETGGEKFVERLKEVNRERGKRDAETIMKIVGCKPEDFKDCMKIPKLVDFIDDRYANFWEGYVENTPKAFEKELFTCPVTEPWSAEPDLCEVLIGESLRSFVKALNPKFKTEGFTKLLTKGDKCCRYRVELEED